MIALIKRHWRAFQFNLELNRHLAERRACRRAGMVYRGRSRRK
jgi:hypothetical protein